MTFSCSKSTNFKQHLRGLRFTEKVVSRMIIASFCECHSHCIALLAACIKQSSTLSQRFALPRFLPTYRERPKLVPLYRDLSFRCYTTLVGVIRTSCPTSFVSRAWRGKGRSFRSVDLSPKSLCATSWLSYVDFFLIGDANPDLITPIYDSHVTDRLTNKS